jgi:hypothetical protein
MLNGCPNYLTKNDRITETENPADENIPSLLEIGGDGVLTLLVLVLGQLELLHTLHVLKLTL